MNRKENNTYEEKFLEFPKMFPPFYRDLETDLCLPLVAEGYEWCFDPTQRYVVEKLNGTNVKLEVVDGLMKIFVRNQSTKGYVEATLNDPNYKYIVQGVSNAVAKRKKRFSDGIHFGEVIGEKYQGNPYKIDTHLWLTFKLASDGVQTYKDAPQTDDFAAWKEWILNLKSLFNPNVEAEGVIFVNKHTGQMAKFRKDMFDVSYQPKRRKEKKRS